jgi:hypothetical protein
VNLIAGLLECDFAQIFSLDAPPTVRLPHPAALDDQVRRKRVRHHLTGWTKIHQGTIYGCYWTNASALLGRAAVRQRMSSQIAWQSKVPSGIYRRRLRRLPTQGSRIFRTPGSKSVQLPQDNQLLLPVVKLWLQLRRISTWQYVQINLKHKG